MVKLIRAMASLLATVADVRGACIFSLTQVEKPPLKAKYMGTQSLVPGHVLLEIRTESHLLKEKHFEGYWSPSRN